ncbi:uncharacterized protein [Antedon mediterranea]|uniref:uncharacterized protein n=1 Tax=Antedon mediterranea TaxID=105859 RepID=UPI003AF80B0A
MDIKLLDGGLGSECSKRGFEIDTDPLWNARLLISNQEDLKDIHKSFLEAGCDFIETSTYQASVEGFVTHAGLSKNEALNLISRSGEIAVEAIEDFWSSLQPAQTKDRCKPIAVGAIGPYGACQHNMSEYHGNYVDDMTVQDLKDWHRGRIEALLKSGVKMMSFETIPAIKEAEAIVSLLQEFPDVTGWLAFTCKNGSETCHGESIQDAIAAISTCPNLSFVGINCCPPAFVTPLLQSAQKASNGKPFVVFPNTRGNWTGCGWTGENAVEDWESYIPEWIQLGAKCIGGCCRTSPEDIQRIQQYIKNSLATN